MHLLSNDLVKGCPKKGQLEDTADNQASYASSTKTRCRPLSGPHLRTKSDALGTRFLRAFSTESPKIFACMKQLGWKPPLPPG